MPIRYIRLAQQDKEHLIRLKTKTGIKQWNILCRWALAASLKEVTPPIAQDIPADSNVEMSWEVFGGEDGDLWLAALKERIRRDGLPPDDITLLQQLRLHIHRGISYLFTPGYVNNIGDLCSIVNRR